MEIKTLNLMGYKCFKDEITLNFSIPDGSIGSGLTVIVGPNNSGKSSILGAMSLLFSNVNDIPKNIRSNEDFLIEVIDSNNESYKIEEHSIDGSKVLRFKNDNHVISDSFMFDKIPVFINKYSSIDINLFNSNKEVFDRCITKILGYCPKYVVENDGDRSYIEVDGLSLGNGISRVFNIVSSVLNNDVIFIDEPELSLYPDVQVRLMDFLKEQSINKQIILCTYSSDFIGGKIIRLDNGVYEINNPIDKRLCFLGDKVIVCNDILSYRNLFDKFEFNPYTSYYQCDLDLRLVLEDLKSLGYKKVFVINDIPNNFNEIFDEYYFYNISEYYDDDDHMDDDIKKLISEIKMYFENLNVSNVNSDVRNKTQGKYFIAKNAVDSYINDGKLFDYIQSKYPRIDFKYGENTIISFRQRSKNEFYAVIDSEYGVDESNTIKIRHFITLNDQRKTFDVKRKVLHNNLPVNFIIKGIHKIKF